MNSHIEEKKEEFAEHLVIREIVQENIGEAYLRLKESYSEATGENIRLTALLQSAEEQNFRLADQCEALKKELEKVRKELEAGEALFRTNYELFKTFADDDSQKIILLDTSYSIRYINRPAAEYLGLSECEVSECRIFDFFKDDDALKIKRKIDEAFIKGEKEKIKDIKFRNAAGRSLKLNIKILRTRYDNRPSVKLLIK